MVLFTINNILIYDGDDDNNNNPTLLCKQL